MTVGSGNRFYGKYRGTVVNNIDPMQVGRILVQVPDVLGPNISSWAMPCLPVGGLQSGFFAVPPIGAGVFVEFEQGDPDTPVWVGAFFAASDLPVLARSIPPGVSGMVLQTMLGNGIVISDVPGPSGGIMIKSSTGATLIVNDTGIYIQNGKGASITLVGPTVTVNAGALVVT